MKKICIITQCSLPVPTVKGGAVETLVEYIINQNEIENKYQFTIISVYNKKAFELSKKYVNTKFIWIQEKNKIINKWLMILYKFLKHLGVYIPFSLEFKEALKSMKKLDEHDLYIYEGGPTTQIPALSKIISKDKLVVHLHWDGMGNKKKDKCFSYLLPVSDYIGNCWKTSTNCSYEKIKPLYNCANRDSFTKKLTEIEKNKLKEKLNIPLQNKVILFIGRIVKEKGIKELLEAFELIKQKNATLLIIGSANFGAQTNTPYEIEIENKIKQSDKSIVFTGFIHQTELYKYYNISNVVVMPSLFQDPAPLVSIEAQSSGTPVIATDVGGIKEYTDKYGVILIKKDRNLIINLVNAIDEILSDEVKEIEMGESCKKHSEKFSINSYFKNFSNIIEDIIQKK